MKKNILVKLAKIFSKYALVNNIMAKEIFFDIVKLCKEENPAFDETRFFEVSGFNV